MSRRFLASAVLLLVVAVSAFAMDFGLTLSNGTTLIFSPDWELYQGNVATLWMSIPVGADSSLYLSGIYEFAASFDEAGSTMVPWRLDVGRTEWEGLAADAFGPESSLAWSVGRIQFGDFSERVVSSLADGFKLAANFGNLGINLGAAYTGLSYKGSANIFIDADDAQIMSDDERYFAPARLMAQTGVRVSELADAFDIGLDIYAQFDLEDGDVSTNGQYMEPYADGRVGRAFRWRAWTVIGLTQADDSALSLAAGGRARWSFPELAGMRLTLTGLWASATGEKLVSFTPLTVSTVGSVSSQPFSNVTAFLADVSLAPLSWLSFGLNLSALMSGDLAADDPFTGVELSLGMGMKPASDFSVDLMGGLYSPYAEETPLKWMFSLAATLSL